MKILMILSQPLIVDSRVSREANALVDAGHEVTVIVWDRNCEYEPEAVIDGIRVIRIHNRGLMKILPNDLFRNPLWWRTAYKKGLELYTKRYRFDVVHCHDLDTLQSGVSLKKKLGIKLIYDAHEIFGYMISGNTSEIFVKTAFWMEKRLVRYVDHIITVSEPLKKYFDEITDKTVTVVMNCENLIIEKFEPPKNNIFTLCYMGGLHKNKMFPEIIDVIGGIRNVKFVIAGKKGYLYDKVKEKCKKYSNIEFLGTISFREAISRILQSDAVVHMVNPANPNNRIGLANKQFEAMVCGRPIITTKGTYAGELTERLKCGLTVEYNEKSVREAIIKLRDNPKLREELGRNGLKAAIKEYNWEKQREKLIKIYWGLK